MIYVATTMRITRERMVTAVKDADKTFNAPETTRFAVCWLDDMVDSDANIREGF